MRSLKDKFDDLCLRIGEGRRLESTGSDPIFYLVYENGELLEVKRQTPAWTGKLINKGWDVVTFSMVEEVGRILKNHPLRKQWLMGEKFLLQGAEESGAPLDLSEIRKTISKALSEGDDLVRRLKEKVDEAAGLKNGLLLITDLEALHPFLRINSLEAQLQGFIRCPIIVFYPGKRDGKTSLKFHEFYPADPNYRSEHIG
ncbi:DUF1788 domain-containing protein [Verrucomicrobiales bacterium]|nr:DUF1788 domain-containing protein [Verrucomicrobiales bacterium]MDC0275414.1 DUF1788 domain-containing protein [Verrucomicrobiales bacterium]